MNKSFDLGVVKWHHSLKFRLLTTVLIAMFGLYWLLEHNVSSVLNDVAEEHAKSGIALTSKALSLAIAPHTSAESLHTLSAYFQDLITGPKSDLLYLALYNEQGQLVASSGLSAYNEKLADLPLAQQIQAGQVHVHYPIVMLNDQRGELCFGISLLDFERNITSIHRENLWILFFAVSLAALVLLLRIMQVNKQLSRIIRANNAFSAGNYSARAKVNGGDELALLSRYFNQMADTVSVRMSELHESQEKVKKLNEQLEQRVEERTRALSSALATLEGAQAHLIQSKKLAGLGALVAGVSHELNTPIGNALTVITTLAERNQRIQSRVDKQSLRKSDLDAYIASVVEAQALASRNLRKAAELIQSFKQVAIDQASHQRRRFNLQAMLKEVLLTIQPMLRKQRVAVSMSVDERIDMMSFPGPLGQVITNLIVNALTHAFCHQAYSSRIEIAAVVSDQAPDMISLRIADNGSGIASENLSKLFDPFYTTRLGQGGSGLGLHIVHNVVHNVLGGRIEVSSELNKGTTVLLLLPINAPESSQAEPMSP